VSAGTFISTAYGPPWGGIQGGGTTATGIKLPGSTEQAVIPIVAVDPSVIPLHSKLRIWPNPFGDPNLVFQAEDTGGAITGNRIDFLDMFGRAHQDGWGRRPVSVTIVGQGSSSDAGATAGASSSSGNMGSTAGAASSSSSGPSEWVKLLADAGFIAFGGFMAYRGGKRLVSRG
jgi:3D (Asp-Asp-Asp) domain-containing protein